MQTEQNILIAGGGLAGSLLAILLAKHGFQVRVYERRPDMRAENVSAGRSINLALSERGIHALDEAGVLDSIMEYAIPMRGRRIHSIERDTTFQPYSSNPGEVIYSIPRGKLNMTLMDAAESYANVTFFFNHRCDHVDPQTKSITVTNAETGEQSTLQGTAIIGTDGAFSAVRQQYFHTTPFNYSQNFLEHGYKELTIPPGENGSFQFAGDALHIWPRRSYMLIALPNSDGSFTCTLFFPYHGEPSFDSLDTEKKVRAFFREQFPDAIERMPALEDDFFINPTGSLVTVRCNPWHLDGNVLLLGDAAHAIVPFFGQGMNAAFEDCTVLNACIREYGSDWGTIFPMMTHLRRENTDAIADLAIDNFIEMRDKTADEDFLFRKKVEKTLEERFPTRFVPRYTMVSFRRIPYSIALKRGSIQDTILDELTEDIDTIEQINWKKAEMLIHNRLEEIVPNNQR